MRIENQNAFPKFIAKRLNRTNLIRISRNQDKALSVRANGIKKHRNGDIDIRPFLFKLLNRHKTISRHITPTAPLIRKRQQCIILRIISKHRLDERIL